ncbi:MAG: hypothetical protein WCS70_12535 [Verrucomicrobiota bacterium]
MKLWFLLLALAMPVLARDNLDSTRGRGWSPNNRWLAFNPVNQDSLFIVNLGGHRNFLLKPVGAVVLDTGNVFASGRSSTNRVDTDKPVTDGITMSIGSPGRNKLEPLEWSAKGDAVAYSVDRKTRAAFSVLDETVLGTFASTNALPWLTPDDLRVTFVFERTTTNSPSRYLMRVVRPDGSLAKEIVFQDPKELQRLSLLRSTESTFLTPNHETLIYPRVVGDRWQLVTQPVAGTTGPRSLTSPGPSAPYEWRLSPDGKTLAVVEGATSIAIGPLTDWKAAERVTFSNLTVNVEWSPDGRFLAVNDRQNLYLVEYDKDAGKVIGEMTRVHSTCSAQYWGWRGSRLIFNDTTGHPADLYYVDVAGADRRVQLLVKNKGWRSAPVLRTISPDGTTFVCLVMEIDGEGRTVHDIWKIKLVPDAEWELVHRWIPGSSSS